MLLPFRVRRLSEGDLSLRPGCREEFKSLHGDIKTERGSHYCSSCHSFLEITESSTGFNVVPGSWPCVYWMLSDTRRGNCAGMVVREVKE